MKLAFSALILMFFAQAALADNLRIDCKNAKIPNAATIMLQATTDFGRSGATSGQNWFLTINNRTVNNAYVRVIKRGINISALQVIFANHHSLVFALAGNNDDKAFVFLVAPNGARVPNTVSYCSMDID